MSMHRILRSDSPNTRPAASATSEVDRLDRAIAGGVAAGLATGLVANLVAAQAGLATLHTTTITPRHILFASLVANVAGALLLRSIRRRVARPLITYLLIALGVGALGTARVVLAPPTTGLLPVAGILHALVPACSTLALAVFYPVGTLAPQGSAGARVLASIAAMATAASAQIADFNGSHVYHPDWPAHARYHAMLVICLMTGVGLVSLDLIWRPARVEERRVRLSIATRLSAVVWAAFVLSLLVPEVSSWPDGFVHRLPVNGNLVLAVGVLLCVAGGEWLERRAVYGRP